MNDYDEFLQSARELSDDNPCLVSIERSDATIGMDWIYAYQDVLAFRMLCSLNGGGKQPPTLIDVGSRLATVMFFAQVCKCTYVDIRPPNFPPAGLGVSFVAADARTLPFPDGTFDILTSLHAIEHFGLGRYGDPIDRNGDIKGIREFARVLKVGGRAIMSVPSGRPDETRTEFNHQRVYSKKSFDAILANAGFVVRNCIFVNPVAEGVLSNEQMMSYLTHDQAGVYVVMCERVS